MDLSYQLPLVKKWSSELSNLYDPLGLDDLDTYDFIDYVIYPEFFFWREDHRAYPEPKPTVTCCPRCFSQKVNIGYPYIICDSCGYNEPLVDFPSSSYFHNDMLLGVNK